MEGTKPWWQSKAVWMGVIAVLVAVYNAIIDPLLTNFNLHLPLIPDWIYSILAAFGIYFRTTATQTIGKVE